MLCCAAGSGTSLSMKSALCSAKHLLSLPLRGLEEAYHWPSLFPLELKQKRQRGAGEMSHQLRALPSVSHFLSWHFNHSHRKAANTEIDARVSLKETEL